MQVIMSSEIRHGETSTICDLSLRIVITRGHGGWGRLSKVTQGYQEGEGTQG